MQQKFITLNFEDINDEFEKNIHCYGIVSFMRSYRLCFYVNKMLDEYKLCYQECELNFSDKKGVFQNAFIQTYQYNDISLGQEMILIGNKTSNGILLPKSNQYDHFILFKNMDEYQINDIMEHLEKLKNTIRFIPLDPAGIANFDRLLLQ